MNNDLQTPKPRTDREWWLEFVGCIPSDDLKIMAQVIESDCENIEPEEISLPPKPENEGS